MEDRIVVLAPHTDDGELGCGGSIAKFIEEGKEVYYVAFSSAKKSLPEGYPDDTLVKEVKAATRILGIKPENLILYDYEVRKFSYVRQDILEDLVKRKRELEPDLVFIPSVEDLHQDPYTVAHAALRAFKETSILSYELPWNNIAFRTEGFIPLEKRHLDKKMKALREYKSQSHRAYLNEDFIYGLAKARGVQIKKEYAEAFEVVRYVFR
jgi:LmbE family N-acetylglucosaminyl deacetylase